MVIIVSHLEPHIRIQYILLTMAKETEREEIKEETHELEDEEKDEIEDEEDEDVDDEET